MGRQTIEDKRWAIQDELVAWLLHEHRVRMRPAFERLWAYYRNELDFGGGDENRMYRAAQEKGLPRRLRMRSDGGTGRGNREIVIENDIAWRVHTLVDFMFGKPVAIESLAGDRQMKEVVERVLGAVFDANGGVCFFQDMALLGSVYGFVDVLLRAEGVRAGAIGEGVRSGGSGGSGSGKGGGGGVPSKPIEVERAIGLASRLILETVEAPRAVPVLDPNDYRSLQAYIVHYDQLTDDVERGGFLSRLVERDGRPARGRGSATVTEIWTANDFRCYRDERLSAEGRLAIGRLPVVHIQNLPQPFFYEGLSDVEPLIPLQDELNTRLSDRANRVTLQSFKMYLGKGIEGFVERPIGPGQMWQTDNESASIEAFGGDGPNPSEDAHINEIRDALDKTSGVSAIAAGLIRNKVGNLTSENAIRLVMMGLLAKTEKKRITYGQGIEQICELVLHTLDVAGVLRTTAEERRVKLHWPSPIPEDESQRLKDAEMKLKLGVPRARVLAELGYTVGDAAVGD